MGLSDGAVEELLGGSPEQVPERYAAASPAQLLPLGVPILLVHGARDDTVPVSLSRDFQRAAIAAGDACDLADRRARRPFRAHRSRVGRMGYGEAVAGGPLTRAHALELDRGDPLAGFRDRFEVGDGDRIYVDGNSLGRLSADARHAMEETVNEWSGRLVTGWHDWIDLPQAVGDLLGQTALGAGRGQVLACDSTTVNLYKLAGAVLAARPGAVVADADDFPTDRYVLEGLATAGGRELRMLRSDPVDGPQAEAVAAAAEGAALVVLSHVNYRSGALADMRAITRAAPGSGSPRAVGSVPFGGRRRGGARRRRRRPGHRLHLQVSERGPRLAGVPVRRPPPPGRAALTDPGLVLAGRSVCDGPGLPAGGRDRPVHGRDAAGARPRRRASGRRAARRGGDRGGGGARRPRLTALAVELHDRRLEPLGFTLGTPRDPARRGAHVSLRHPDAWRICRALIEHQNVVPDFRHPDSIRFGLPPVYTRFVDVWDAFDRLVALMEAGTHLRMPAEAARVT